MARAVEVLGLRACLAQSTMDSGQGLPGNWALHTTDYCIQSQKQLYNKHHDTADGRIRIWLGIRQIMNATDKLLIDTRDTAKELKTGIHMHVAEIPYENQLVVDTREVDHGTVTYLEKINFLQGNLLAAHSVWVSEAEVENVITEIGKNYPADGLLPIYINPHTGAIASYPTITFGALGDRQR